MRTPPRWVRFLVLLLLGLGPVFLARSALARKKHSHARRPVPIDYVREIHPILQTHCVSCHGPRRQKAGLRLDSVAFIRKGADSGAVIVPGDAANSLLISVLSAAGDAPQMPPDGDPLDDKEVTLLRTWIDRGATAPADEPQPEPETAPEKPRHWAFQPPVAADPPGTTGPADPIDAFLAAERDKHGLTPSPPLGRSLLLRRLTLDLTGLPPTRAELHAFLSDPSPTAYENAVDRLLASPAYGERWARHWMDVWRYSDPDGRKAKADVWWSNEHIWRWRDWIIRSLNEDMGYDRMVVDMLAGDEAAPTDPGALAATGFLVRNWFKLDRNISLNNTVEHTAKAFLGLTVGCARCHDHKFDPISQREYFQFRAYFQTHDMRVDPLPGADEKSKEMVAHAWDAHLDEPTYLLVRGDERTPDKSASIPAGTPAALGPAAAPPTQVPTPWGGSTPSSGRRLALARWLTARDNPLTARVAVNHVWARHFGRPLVDHVADFGLRTPAPIHQALLDWLAVDLMDHGWSLKRLHRLIVCSAAYRMQSGSQGGSAADAASDPENLYYWRMNPRRLESEGVRDSLLHLAGALDPSIGGPPLDCLAKEDSARRSLYYRYSREDKLGFLMAFDAAGVEECYRRQESIVPGQALALENSDFVWDQARRIAALLSRDADLSAHDFTTATFEHVLGRAPTPEEVSTCEQFLKSQEKLLSDPQKLTVLPDAPPPPPEPTGPGKPPGLPLIYAKLNPLPHVPAAADPRSRAREHLVHALINHNDFITVR